MDVRLLVVVVAFLSACSPDESTPSDAPHASEQPNVVWLVAEDLSPVIPAFGDSTVATPNLSRLARDGVRYTHVFSPSGVCAPSRAALATGMYPTSIGAMHMRTGPWWAGEPPPDVLAAAAKQMPGGIEPYEALPPPGVRVYAEYLRRSGYYAINNSKEDYQFIAPVTVWDESSPTAHWRNRAAGQPFFAVFTLMVTHESRIWSKAGDSLLVPDSMDVPVPPYLPDTEVVRSDIRRMYSNVVEMDARVGALLADLEEYGLLDSTIVFWLSDNGGSLPRQKRTLYDSGIRVPLIIRYPDRWRAGEVDDRLISFVDFLPTLLSLTGLEPPANVNGRAFEGRYATEEDRKYVHAAADRLDEYYDTIRAVRSRRYKYLRNLRTDQGYYLPIAYREQMPAMKELLRMREEGMLDSIQALWFRNSKPEEELFDTVLDPHEVRNLAGEPEYREVLAEHRAEYERWAGAVPDYGLVPEAEYLESIWPGGVRPVTAAPTGEWQEDRLALSSATPGASIGYQILRGDEVPDARWEVYVEPILVQPGKSVVAVAHRIGYRPSPVESFSRHAAAVK